MSDITPRIYVACLASYNSGILHGAWIDATIGVDSVRAEIAKILRESKCPNVMVDCPNCENAGDPELEPCSVCKGSGKVPSAEEFAIHDSEGFAPMKIGEYDSIEKVCELAELIEEHGPAYAAFADNVGIEYANPDDFQEAFQGEHDSQLAFTEQLIDDIDLLNGMPENLKNYFDYEAYSRDLFMSDYYSIESDNGVYVFSNI